MPAKGATCRPNCSLAPSPPPGRGDERRGRRPGERRPQLPRSERHDGAGAGRRHRCTPATGELLARRRPERLRQDDAAGADLRPAATRRGLARVRARRADAPARSAAAVAGAPSTTRRWRCGSPACHAREARRRAEATVRRARHRGLPARGARASSPAACASGSPSCGRCCRASRCCASTSRSARSTRSPAAEMQEWLAGALAREPRTVVLVTHDVEEAILLADRVARALAQAGARARRARGGAGAAAAREPTPR